MVKCEVCKSEIEKTFLNKIKGTYMRIGKKQKIICNTCQSKFSKEEILKKID
ncbi:hypothetical protein J4426_01035 [Candidatus Woesearchaeota archaeon]|nr:hypothetical protein [Candidatus Woesearchaeota archaeon]